MANVAAEVCRGGEPEHDGKPDNCQVFVAQKARYIERSIAFYPVVGGVVAPLPHTPRLTPPC